MAHVHFSRGKAYELAPSCDEHPTEYVESEGERLIKQMVQKQMNTHVSLEQQLEKPKEFETCMEFIPLTKYTSGQISFSEFKDFAQKITHWEDLKSSGLSEKEIDLLNDYEKGEKHFEEKYKKVEVSALQTSLQEIHKKLHQKTDDLKNKQSGVSRHELELSLSVKPESDHTKLLQFALSCQTSEAVDSRPLNHPIHSLKEIEHELFDHLKPVPRKRKRKFNNGSGNKPPSTLAHQDTCCSSRDSFEPSTLWDSHVAPRRRKREMVRKEKTEVHNYTCAPKPLYTVRDGKIIPLDKTAKEVTNTEKCPVVSRGQPFVVPDSSENSSVQPTLLKAIQENRIDMEDILKSPYFQNYQKGEPSQVLYVKNISSAVEEADLVRYFGHFETPGEKKITYRLMTGRMRGQAFITFPSVDKASQALEALNGCNCKGKPLVIQFGRSKS